MHFVYYHEYWLHSTQFLLTPCVGKVTGEEKENHFYIAVVCICVKIMVTKSTGIENRREKESIVQVLSLKTKTKNGST